MMENRIIRIRGKCLDGTVNIDETIQSGEIHHVNLNDYGDGMKFMDIRFKDDPRYHFEYISNFSRSGIGIFLDDVTYDFVEQQIQNLVSKGIIEGKRADLSWMDCDKLSCKTNRDDRLHRCRDCGWITKKL